MTDKDLTLKQKSLLATRRVWKEIDLSSMMSLPFKCCRYAFLLPPDRIGNVFLLKGDNIEVYNNTNPDEPEHGFLMQEPGQGYPCTALTKDGCKYVVKGGEKPLRCQDYPTSRTDGLCTSAGWCSFTFDKNGIRSGSCNQCK